MLATPWALRESATITITELDVTPHYLRKKMPGPAHVARTVARLRRQEFGHRNKRLLEILHYWPAMATEVIYEMHRGEKAREKKAYKDAKLRAQRLKKKRMQKKKEKEAKAKQKKKEKEAKAKQKKKEKKKDAKAKQKQKEKEVEANTDKKQVLLVDCFNKQLKKQGEHDDCLQHSKASVEEQEGESCEDLPIK